MTWYLVSLETDPDIHYKVHIYEPEGMIAFIPERAYKNHVYPQALFAERKLAYEYAAYRNLKLHQ